MPPTVPFMQPVLSGPGKKLNSKIDVVSVSEPKLTLAKVSVFLESPAIGLAPGFSDKGKLIALAVCDGANALIIDFNGGGARKAPPKPSSGSSNSGSSNDSGTSSDASTRSTPDPQKLIENNILCRPSDSHSLAAFDMGPLAMALYSDKDLRIKNAIDMQTAFPESTPNKPYSVVQTALQVAQLDRIRPSAERIESEFRNPEYNPEQVNSRKELACRAWLAQFLLEECIDANTMEDIKKINTKEMATGLLEIVAKMTSDAHRLSLGKATTTKHRIKDTENVDGKTKFNAASYKNKFRGEGMSGRAVVEGSRGRYVLHAAINSTSAGSGAFELARPIDPTANIISIVETTGRDDPTRAEARRAEVILRILQGETGILEVNPWIQNIWFPPDDGPLVWPEEWSAAAKNTPRRPKPQPQPQPHQPQKAYKMPLLNGSQQKAVNSMLSSKDLHRLVSVQGPPGTGKTSVIAAYVLMGVQLGIQGVWLIAQSNVAVKNIALKLLSVGFEDWKLLVSKDFHTGWHEHLYTEDDRFRGHVVLSDRFSKIKPEDLQDCKVILATLSMLSNDRLLKFTRSIPMNVLIVDEASQIEIGSYVAPLTTFPSLRKICFIGDNKQLPPHGQEDLKNLRSIFEVTHLEKDVIFLNTQYRMPPEIGDIISSTVYDGKLLSNPAHPIPPTTISCYFIDIPNGRETKEGTSWKNLGEKAAVLKLAQHLQDLEKAYRIITPYEGQTTLIETEMKKTEGLSWADKCFNVDAFQGNEEDYIIISLVRSRDLGFLNNLRRTNVMLSRCKKGMFIITSRKFMEGVGGDSLVGEMLDKLEEKWEEKVWLTEEDVEKGRIFSGI